MSFEFEYEFASGNRFIGVLRGDLQPDGDTVSVSQVESFTYTGQPALGFSIDGLTPNFDTVSLSGGVLRLISEPPTATLGGFVIDDSPDAGEFGAAAFGGMQVFIESEFLNRASWSLAPVVAPEPVPEPATLMLLTAALALAVQARRRKPSARD